jgi:tetratricopeptide (TPR) repeat protein
MGWFSRLFSGRGKAEALYNRGLEKAKAKDFAGALSDYTSVIDGKQAHVDIQAMALFNRGLAYSLQGDAVKAERDYAAVIELPGAPASVVAAAKEKRERVRRRTGGA